MKKKDLFLFFMQYSQGIISKEDKIKLEKLLKKFPELSEEWEMHLELYEILSDSDTAEFRDWIVDLIKNVSSQKDFSNSKAENQDL